MEPKTGSMKRSIKYINLQPQSNLEARCKQVTAVLPDHWRRVSTFQSFRPADPETYTWQKYYKKNKKNYRPTYLMNIDTKILKMLLN